MAPARLSQISLSDHDLLIVINTKVEVLTAQISQSYEVFSSRLDRVEREKAAYVDLDVLRRSIEEHSKTDKEIFAELGTKVDWARKMIFLALGILTALEFVGGLWLTHLFSR